MSKFARVGLLPVIFVFLFTAFSRPAFAGFLDFLKPILGQPKLTSLANNYAPSVTFGDLLNAEGSFLQNPVPTPDTSITEDEKEIKEKTARFKKLLAQLEQNYEDQLSQFREKQKSLPVNDRTLAVPTPFIAVSSLISGISELASITIYPTPTLTDQLLLALVNNGMNANTGILDTNPPQTTFTVALLGDSMTDTLGKDLKQLKGLLQEAYPDYTFILLNFGQGGTDMESGLKRLTDSTTYLGESYLPLLSYKPDILVVESFAYNHWSGEKYDLDRQWLTIAKIIDTVREKSQKTKIVLASSIAPNKHFFGDGVLNWPKHLKEESSLIIKAYLQNMINYATSEGYPLADAYHPSLGADGEGNMTFINSSDRLHPSSEGAYLYSLKIVEAIKNNGLIN